MSSVKPRRSSGALIKAIKSGAKSRTNCKTNSRKRAEEVVEWDSPLLTAIDKILSATLTCETDEDLGTTCLAVAEELAQSKFGFTGEISEDKLQNNLVHMTTIRDVTERKRSELRQELTASVLKVLNQGDGEMNGLIREVLQLIKSTLVFDAVGLRLRKDNDCPYFEQNGFSEDFLREENFLCAKRGDGSILKDENGNTVLECTCGLVLSGRIDPTLPFFTTNGSFWTNQASGLLSLPLESDPRTNPRNNCIHRGYQSVAIIPIRSGQEILGLLQLNDRNEERLTPDLVRYLERIGDQLGLALRRMEAQEELRLLNESLEQRIAERTAISEQTAQQLRLLALELTMAEERERQRLAQVLHDGLQQILAGARYQLATIENSDERKNTVTAVASLIDEAIETSRSLTAELSPPILHQSGFIAGLKWLSGWMREKHGFDVQLILQEESCRLPSEMSVFLFHAVKELLFNVTKHAHVKSAKVEIPRLSGNMLVIVDDEGAGFDPTQLRSEGGSGGGFGLFKVSERLSMLGGKMTIESSPGKGSRVTLSIPEVDIKDEDPSPFARRTHQRRKVADPKEAPEKVSGPEKTRIVLIDDHAVVRHGLALMLQEEPDFEIVGEASDGEGGVDLVRRVRPDVVLMDISMPGMSGIRATQIIHSEFPQISVIGLSMFQEGEQAAAMRNAGAVRYLAKSGPPDMVIAAIRSCMQAAVS